MICRNGRLKFIPKIASFSSNPHSFAALHQFSSQNNNCGPYNSKPQKPRKSFEYSINNQERFKGTPETTVLTPQAVLAALQNSPSDLTALTIFLWCAKQHNYFHDKPAFRHMAGVMSNLTRKYGNVRRILEELEAAGCIIKAQTLLLLMRIYWCGAMYDMVVEAFEEMCSCGYVPNTYARNIVMDVMFKTGHVEAALRMLDETKLPNFLSFNTAVCNLCRLSEADKVKVVLRCMLRKGYYMNPETYTMVLNCFCKIGMLDEALQLLGMMTVVGVHVSVNVWSILIDCLCKVGKIEVAAYLLEKMVDIGCSPNIVTCTSLVKGFLESRMPARAFEIVNTLESKGCFPDLVLCNVLIDCLSKIGWYDNAFAVFSSLRELKLMPDVYTYSSLLSTVCLSKQYLHLPLLTSGLSVQPDLVVCNGLLNYYCKAGYPEGAVEFYNDMIDRGFFADKYTFAGVLSALIRLGRMRQAVNVYHGIIRTYEEVDAHIHTIMINGLAKSGSLHMAMRLFRNAAASEKFLLDVVSYNVAIEGLIQGGEAKEAYALFSQMKKVDMAPNKRSYNLILSGFFKDRNVEMVKHVLLEMVDGDIEIDHHTYKLMKNIFRHSPNSLFSFNLFLELRNLGLLPKVEQGLLVDVRDTHFSSSTDFVEVDTSSSDEFPDAIVSVG